MARSVDAMAARVATIAKAEARAAALKEQTDGLPDVDLRGMMPFDLGLLLVGQQRRQLLLLLILKQCFHAFAFFKDILLARSHYVQLLDGFDKEAVS